MNKQMRLSALNDELAQVRTKKKSLEQIERKDLSAKSKELDRVNKRLADLDKLFRKAFEA